MRTSITPPAPGAARARRRALLIAFGLLTIGLCAWLAYMAGERHGLAELRADSNHRLDLFSSAVHGVVKRLEHVPATVQLNPDILEMLRKPEDGQRLRGANDYVRRLNAHLGSIAVFVINDRGIVLASSNTDAPDDSLLHQDLSFRPYFLEALSGRVGRHFAIGINGDRPGYFVSHPIRDGARVVGVATIKIGLEAIDQTWELLGARALLADTNHVVIMSSQPEWRYTALNELPIETRVDLQLNRMYNNRRVARFPLRVQLTVDDDDQVVEQVQAGSDGLLRAARQPEMLVLSRTVDGMDWRLMTFPDLAAVRHQAVLYALVAGIAASFALLLALYLAQNRRILRQRQEARVLLERVNAELEQNVARRTEDLTVANLRLRKEVRERERAEQTLRDAQGELVHSAKMAILGRLASSITHELTQPLGAIRTLSGNAAEFLRRGELEVLSGNLGIISRMADQMGRIIQPLKGFARKSRPMPEQTDIARAVGNALFLFESRLRAERIEVDNRCVPGQVSAWCDGNRLEQVLINLIGNAIDSMVGDPVAPDAARRLVLQAAFDGPHVVGDASDDATAEGPSLPPSDCVRIDVIDSGAGLGEEALLHLFEPFFTTKPNGAGLGLGLAISRDIVREFHGDIEAGNDAGPDGCGGARFSVFLPTRAPAMPPAAQRPALLEPTSP